MTLWLSCGQREEMPGGHQGSKAKATEKDSRGPRKRAKSVPITIEQIVKDIKTGKANDAQIAKPLGIDGLRVQHAFLGRVLK
jgi:hypothetical protein